MMTKSAHFVLIALLIFPAFAWAMIEAYTFKDAEMEATYHQLIKELRCLVCQNQNLADSDADLARDLRRQTHDMLMEGNTPQQISQYMVDRYGDFVLYRPRFKASTWLLWLGPFVLVVAVLWLVIGNIRAKKAPAQPDHAMLRQAWDLLSEDNPPQSKDRS